MRLIAGSDLAEVIGGEPVAPTRVWGLFDNVASALEHVHRQGHVHRDVKPHNVLVAYAGHPHEYAVLTDFGIARALNSSTALTRGLLGTAAYMAPEILLWQPAVPASDQYSFACVLFEMLTGGPPYHDKELPAAHIHEPVPRLVDFAPHLSPALSEVLSRALAKSPEDRFAGVREFATAVKQVIADGVEVDAHPPEVRPNVGSPPAEPRAAERESVPSPAGSPVVEEAISGSRQPESQLQSHRKSNEPSRWRRGVVWHLWMTWALLPYLNGLTWVHAWTLTRAMRHLLYAAAYGSVPFAALLELAITGSSVTSTALAAVAVVAWLVGMVHVLVERRAVVRRIRMRREGR